MCRLVAKSNDKSPPHLHARPRLPVYPMGDWISSSCETRPIGTFLMRRMKFTDHQNGKLHISQLRTFGTFRSNFLFSIFLIHGRIERWQVLGVGSVVADIPGPFPLFRRSSVFQRDPDRLGYWSLLARLGFRSCPGRHRIRFFRSIRHHHRSRRIHRSQPQRTQSISGDFFLFCFVTEEIFLTIFFYIFKNNFRAINAPWMAVGEWTDRKTSRTLAAVLGWASEYRR